MKKIKNFIAALCAAVIAISVLPARAIAAPDGRLLAITFDDGPGKYTDELLDGLETRGVTATFFVLGSLVGKYPNAVRRIVQNGHQLASHTYSHLQLAKLSAPRLKSEIDDTRAILATYGGEQTYYIRPPYGYCNAAVKKAANAPLILWSVDPLDWKYRDTATVTENIVSSVQDGDIILLHDIHETSVKAALRSIDALRAEGYEFVTVSELFRRRGIDVQNGEKYYCARNEGVNLGPSNDAETLKERWASDAISYALENDIADLFDDGSFRPNYSMSRGAFAAALGRLWLKNGGDISAQGGAEYKFSDLPASSDYGDYIRWASSEGIMTGYGGGKFGYYDAVTREQMAVCVTRYLKFVGADVSDSDAYLSYNDASKIAKWARGGIGCCTDKGLLKGNEKGDFRPKTNMTRAQAVTVIKRIDELLQDLRAEKEAKDPALTQVLTADGDAVMRETAALKPKPPEKAEAQTAIASETEPAPPSVAYVARDTFLIPARLIYRAYSSILSLFGKK